MKKTLYAVFTIFVFIFLLGCSPDQYSLEKEFWKTKRKADVIFQNPHASPPAQLEQAVNLLNNFIQKHPDNKLAVEAEFNIARLYIVKEQYDDARQQLEKIIKKYTDSQSICSEAVFLIGNSYQIEDKWNLALQQYKKIIQDYPTTPLGLEVPIYIAQYYNIKSLPEKMQLSYEEAALHYKTLANKYPNTVLSYATEKLAAQCYIAIKDWKSAVTVLNSVIEKYKDKVNLDEAFIIIALIYKKELNDKIKTKETLENLIEEYPKSRFVNTAKKLLEEMNKNE